MNTVSRGLPLSNWNENNKGHNKFQNKVRTNILFRDGDISNNIRPLNKKQHMKKGQYNKDKILDQLNTDRKLKKKSMLRLIPNSNFLLSLEDIIKKKVSHYNLDYWSQNYEIVDYMISDIVDDTNLNNNEEEGQLQSERSEETTLTELTVKDEQTDTTNVDWETITNEDEFFLEQLSALEEKESLTSMTSTKETETIDDDYLSILEDNLREESRKSERIKSTTSSTESTKKSFKNKHYSSDGEKYLNEKISKMEKSENLEETDSFFKIDLGSITSESYGSSSLSISSEILHRNRYDGSIQGKKQQTISSIFDDIDQFYIPAQFKGKCYLNDFTNKVLIIDKNNIQVVKTNLKSSDKSKIVFVIDKSVIAQIKQNTYNLDDMQYGIAKAMGIEPEKLKLSYIVTQLKNVKTEFSKINIARMWEEEPRYVSCELTTKPLKKKKIKIEVKDLNNEKKIINLTIYNLTSGFQWLGGYRNNKTGKIYYHSTSQTEPRNYYTGNLKILHSRDTQTPNPCKEMGTNVFVEHSTQMWRGDHYIPADTDNIVSPKPYVFYDVKKLEEAKVQAALIIQKYWRGYKVRKLFTKELTAKKKADEMFKPKPKEDYDEDKFHKEVLNMIFPYRTNHFYKLYWMLSKKMKDQNNQLKLNENKDCTLTNLESILLNRAKEAEYLKGIQQKRTLATFTCLQKEDKEHMELSLAPLIKHNPDKDILYLIEEQGTEMCKECKNVNAMIKRKNLPHVQRLELLLQLIQGLEKVEDFEMKNDLRFTMETECIFICSGVSENYLQGLRKRSEAIIYQFIKSPERLYNLKHYKKPNTNKMYRCLYCKKMKYFQYFPSLKKEKHFNYCNSCLFTFRTSYAPMNVSTYTNLAKQIRLDEYKKGCQNPYVALLQPHTVELLINKIWGGKSALNKNSTFSDLRLPRWDNRKTWAPWNCILLASDEAKVHESIENVYEFYGEEFCQNVERKNLSSLIKFGSMTNIEKTFRNVWTSLPEKKINMGPKFRINVTDTAKFSFFHPPVNKT